MKMTKKILGILLACLMLVSLIPANVFATAAGTQENPIDANAKWFGWGVDCFLMNTTIEAGDTDGVWYRLTADAAGILQVEHDTPSDQYSVSEDGEQIPVPSLEYQITVTVNGKEYVGYENGVYNAPITTYPVAVGDVVTIHIISRDTSLGGLVYCNAKIVSGDQNNTIKVKSAPAKLHIAAGATVYYQDDSLQAEYATRYVTLSGDSVENVTLHAAGANSAGTIVQQATYTDTDKDGVIEGQLGGSQATTGSPAVKPAWIIENASDENRCFILSVTEEAHECVYDDDDDIDCNVCGEKRGGDCSHDKLNTRYVSSEVSGHHTVVYDCSECGETVNTEDGQCFGGSATCISPATCEGCKEPYGEANGVHIFDDDGDFICINCGEAITTIAISTDAEANAGDEIKVTVNLENLDRTPGLIGAQIEIGFDPDVLELVTYFDEDEETWLPQIEVGSKYNASGNKYITFAPIDEDTGVSERCLVQYLRATATANQVRTETHFFTATFKVKDDAYSGSYELFVKNYSPKNIISYTGSGGGAATNCAIQNCSITINGIEPPCQHEYTYACDKICALCGQESNPGAAHNLQHVDAVDATCTESGNVEYWHCDICGCTWLDAQCTQNTDLSAVVLPATDHIYDDDMDADCNACGDIRLVVYEVKTFGGNAIAEDDDGLSGLVFRFNLTDKIQGLQLVNGSKYEADYSAVTVTPDSTGTYKLVTMGATVTNAIESLDVPVQKWVLDDDDDAPYYAIRIIDIPEEQYNAVISCIPYFVYDVDGDLNTTDDRVTVYGDTYAACVADYMG